MLKYWEREFKAWLAFVRFNASSSALPIIVGRYAQMFSMGDSFFEPIEDAVAILPSVMQCGWPHSKCEFGVNEEIKSGLACKVSMRVHIEIMLKDYTQNMTYDLAVAIGRVEDKGIWIVRDRLPLHIFKQLI